MTPLDGPALPRSKATALVRGERKYRRKVAGPKRWQAIADAKQGPCRVTGAPPPCELHHVVARVHGGADSESNIVPLSPEAHGLVTRRDPVACRALLESLDDAEYSYMCERGGENYAERAYGLVYDRTAASATVDASSPPRDSGAGGFAVTGRGEER